MGHSLTIILLLLLKLSIVRIHFLRASHPKITTTDENSGRYTGVAVKMHLAAFTPVAAATVRCGVRQIYIFQKFLKCIIRLISFLVLSK